MIKYIVPMWAIILLPLLLQAQPGQPGHGWHQLDKARDGVFGSSMVRTYAELLKGKKARPVIVAVIDGGVDIGHEDLKNVVYVNKGEKPGNGRDDDGNGYVDDVHGWNFLGTTKTNIYMDNQEIVRQLRKAIKTDPASEPTAALRWEIFKQLQGLRKALSSSEQKLAQLRAIAGRIGKDNPSLGDFKGYRYQNGEEEKLLLEIVGALKGGGDFGQYVQGMTAQQQKWRENIDYQLNIDYDPRTDPEFQGRYYGNPHSDLLSPFHGTHVAGIIAAQRNNGIGMDGIADQVRIMPLTIVPGAGTVRDQDIASAIRYAVDNGARVINMSLGKQMISVDRQLVDEAVRYAGSKDVLIVHGAGNDGWNLDHYEVYPKKQYKDGGESAAWIEVGASGSGEDEYLLAAFSNYSKNKVDICAPGVAIYSTVPGNGYASVDGTSMAAPIVSGVAAMLRAYYPRLTAVQVKDIILSSATKVSPDLLVSTAEGMLPFTEVCSTGGIINAYQAFERAGLIQKQHGHLRPHKN